MVWHEGADKCLAEVVKKMPTVGNLHGLRRGRRSRLGIKTCSIPADNLCSRMSSKPLCCTLRAAIRQQIDNLTAFKVTKNRAVPVPLTPCPVIDSQHPRSVSGRHEHLTAQLAEQCRPAG